MFSATGAAFPGSMWRGGKRKLRSPARMSRRFTFHSRHQ